MEALDHAMMEAWPRSCFTADSIRGGLSSELTLRAFVYSSAPWPESTVSSELRVHSLATLYCRLRKCYEDLIDCFNIITADSDTSNCTSVVYHCEHPIIHLLWSMIIGVTNFVWCLYTFPRTCFAYESYSQCTLLKQTWACVHSVQKTQTEKCSVQLPLQDASVATWTYNLWRNRKHYRLSSCSSSTSSNKDLLKARCTNITTRLSVDTTYRCAVTMTERKGQYKW